MRFPSLRRLFRRSLSSLAPFQTTTLILTILTLTTFVASVSAQPSAPIATPVSTAPTKLLVDLLEKTD